MANQPRANNRHRMVRVEDDLWEAARVAAEKEGTTRAEVMREGLRALVDRVWGSDERPALADEPDNYGRGWDDGFRAALDSAPELPSGVTEHELAGAICARLHTTKAAVAYEVARAILATFHVTRRN